MTYLQPNKNSSLINRILAGFAVALIIGVFGMVALYNATVNLSHNITKAKTELDAIGAASTQLNNSVVQALSAAGLSATAARDGLVVDNSPEYFPVQQSWPIASHY
jgi:hypothetical protein